MLSFDYLVYFEEKIILGEKKYKGNLKPSITQYYAKTLPRFFIFKKNVVVLVKKKGAPKNLFIILI